MRHFISAVRLACLVSCLAVPAPCQQAPRAETLLRALILTGANNHDWEWTSPELERLLEESGRFEADVAQDPTSALADLDRLRGYHVLVLDYNGARRWGEPAEGNLTAAVRGGIGVVVIHAANNAFPGWVDYEELVALCWREGTGHGRFHAFDVQVIDRDHPITADMDDLQQHPDELYHRLVPMHGAEYRVLATARSSVESGGTGRDEPMIVVKRYGEGRVFHTPLGHVWKGVPASRASYEDPQFRQLVARGTEWAATGTVTLPALPPDWVAADERQAGFRLLFDGRTTRGWRGYRDDEFPAEGWAVERGTLRCLGEGGGDIVTEESFGDFELRFEWAVAPGANSGVIYRCDESEGACWQTGPEYQVLDDGAQPGESSTSAGSLYGLLAPKGVVLRTAGQFNAAAIVVRGGRVEHWLNGAKVLECDLGGEAWQARVAASKFAAMPKFGRLARGHIALQDHGDVVWYRRLRVLELD